MSHTIETTRSDFAVYAMSFLYASACTTFADDAALIAMNDRHPSGTSGGWKFSRENFKAGEPNPCPCSLVRGRRHLLFEASS